MNTLDIVKIVGTILASGAIGWQVTGSVEGALANVGTALVTLFTVKPELRK